MTDNEIREAIANKLKCPGEEENEISIKIKDKPNKWGKKYAHLQIPMEWARKLIENKKIKIGWDRCRLVEQTTPIRCFNCQTYGHYASECRKPPSRLSECLQLVGEIGALGPELGSPCGVTGWTFWRPQLDGPSQ